MYSQSELHELFLLVMQSLPAPQRLLYGVVRRPLKLGDGFHVVNISCSTFSLSLFGEVQRDNHRDPHPQRAQQLEADICMNDPVRAQEDFDHVMAGSPGGTFKLEWRRERLARWLENPRQSAFVTKAMKRLTADGASAPPPPPPPR